MENRYWQRSLPGLRKQKDLAARHRERFGQDPLAWAYAPGRVEILGNHTDYNEGLVLSAAIQLGTSFLMSPGQGVPGSVKLAAENLGQTTSFIIGKTEARELPAWARYVLGVFSLLDLEELNAGSWDASFFGDLPQGSGLSSSAALEVSAALAVHAALKLEPDKLQLAKVCQRAEYEFAGTKSGLLDQFSSLYGVEGGLILCDFRDLGVNPVSFPTGYSFLLLSPDIRHELASSPYNARRESCESATRKLAQLLSGSGRQIKALRDLDPEDLIEHGRALRDEELKRARHVVSENERVKQAAAVLDSDNTAEDKAKTFGSLMYASHESSRLDFENSIPELDLLVQISREAGALGARLSGGGWGGSVIALVRDEEAARVSRDIEGKASAEGLQLAIKDMRPSGGARAGRN